MGRGSRRHPGVASQYRWSKEAREFSESLSIQVQVTRPCPRGEVGQAGLEVVVGGTWVVTNFCHKQLVLGKHYLPKEIATQEGGGLSYASWGQVWSGPSKCHLC